MYSEDYSSGFEKAMRYGRLMLWLIAWNTENITSNSTDNLSAVYNGEKVISSDRLLDTIF